MRKLLRKLLFLFYKPYGIWVTSRERTYKGYGLTLQVPVGVFHPGLFFSTLFITDELLKLPLAGKTLLDIGCGSGMIALSAAKAGAIVTAIDINPLAVEATTLNATINHLNIQVVQSNLLDKIQPQTFDVIAINPPYFKKDPKNAIAAAWFAGSNYSYFKKLFSQLNAYTNTTSMVLMVVSEDVDMGLIRQIAGEHGFALSLKVQKTIMFELNYVYAITHQ